MKIKIAENTPYFVCGEAVRCGGDWTVAITGGERPHIGAISLAVYEHERNSATVSTITVYGHRDDQVSSAAAKMLSTALSATVTVSAGLHLDSASPSDIAALEKNARLCMEQLLTKMQRV